MGKIKIVSIDSMIDKYVGIKGSIKRDIFEKKLNIAILRSEKKA